MRCCQLNRAFDAVYDPVSLLLLLLMQLIIKQYCLLYNVVIVVIVIVVIVIVVAAFGKHLHNDHFIGKPQGLHCLVTGGGGELVSWWATMPPIAAYGVRYTRLCVCVCAR